MGSTTMLKGDMINLILSERQWIRERLAAAESEAAENDYKIRLYEIETIIKMLDIVEV